MKDSVADVCRERVMDGPFHGHDCGRKAKGTSEKDGRPLCGIHLRAEKKNAEADKRWREEWDARNAFEKEIKEKAANAGISVSTTKRGNENVVVIDKATFEMLLKEYAKGKKDGDHKNKKRD